MYRGFAAALYRPREALVCSKRPFCQLGQLYWGVMPAEVNCVWLKMLYISARNMITRLSLFNGKSFAKDFPLKSERRVIMFRAEMYNIFNHTQFTSAGITPQYNWPNWQNGLLEQTSASLGRY